MKKVLKRLVYVAFGIAFFWTALTIYAQYSGKANKEIIESQNGVKTALIVYNPDPFYNLDEQVCKSFAEGISEYGFNSKVVTAKLAIEEIDDFDLYVFCANTYNWAPDWKITSFIKNHPKLKEKNVVAITLGSGSTEDAQTKLEAVINNTGANMLASKTYWLMRPNDENRIDESNVAVANDMAKTLGETIAQGL